MMTVTTESAPVSATDSDDAVPGTWRGVLAPLGRFASTRDRRLLAKPEDGAPRTRPLPLPLLYQDALAPGHEGGVPVGVIDRAWIEGNFLMGEGRFDLEDERARDVARKVHQNWLRFVSVDLDDDSHEIGCIGGDRELVDCGTYAESDDPEELPAHQGVVFSDWRLMGATLVTQPAFPEAFLSSYVENGVVEGQTLTDSSALTASSQFALGGVPFADRGHSWDAAAARKRLAKWASSDGSGDKDKVNFGKYGRAFLVKGSDGDFGGYKFPVADVIGGDLKIVFAAVVASAAVVRGARGGTDEPTGGIKSQITSLYHRAAKFFKDPSIKPPWDKGKDEDSKKSAASLLRSTTTERAAGQFAPDGWRPPDAWFHKPPFDEGCPWTVTDDRVFGHLALWNVCHIGVEKRCIMAPPSATGYAYYATRLLETSTSVREVGVITMDTGHASLEAMPAAATAHYDNTGTMAAVVAIGEDEHGIWCAGSLLPHLTDDEKLRLSLASLSGDWRSVRGGMELVASLAVNTPGFPQTRARSGAAGAPFAAQGCGAIAANGEERTARAAQVMSMERAERVRTASARLGRTRIESMRNRMASLQMGAAAKDAADAVAALAEAFDGEGQDGEEEYASLSEYLIAALDDPDILAACTGSEEDAAVYADVAEAEAFKRKRPGDGTNWIEQTTTGHLPVFIRRVADHLMAKGMTESHAIAVAVNVIKKWCKGGASGNPLDGLNWPKQQKVKAKTRAQGCKDLAHWETKRAETKSNSAEDVTAMAEAVSS